MRAVPHWAIDEVALKGRRARASKRSIVLQAHTLLSSFPIQLPALHAIVLYCILSFEIPTPYARFKLFTCVLLFKCVEVGFQCSLAMHQSDRWPNCCIPMWVSWSDLPWFLYKCFEYEAYHISFHVLSISNSLLSFLFLLQKHQQKKAHLQFHKNGVKASNCAWIQRGEL